MLNLLQSAFKSEERRSGEQLEDTTYDNFAKAADERTRE